MAESCTSGMVAAELGQIPGISSCFCGSMVVYQTKSKIAWLDLDERQLNDPSIGPVSAWASRNLAEGLLIRTPHATVAAAITGHFGPGAPPELDGVIYMALISRGKSDGLSHEIRLNQPPPLGPDDIAARRARQSEATGVFLEWLNEVLDD
ncbi:MAG: CinA family protein [Pirellula sp.]|nr:CinA family protein [Pirellula sp.]